jgi:hypothetical protein
LSYGCEKTQKLALGQAKSRDWNRRAGAIKVNFSNEHRSQSLQNTATFSLLHRLTTGNCSKRLQMSQDERISKFRWPAYIGWKISGLQSMKASIARRTESGSSRCKGRAARPGTAKLEPRYWPPGGNADSLRFPSLGISAGEWTNRRNNPYSIRNKRPHLVKFLQFPNFRSSNKSLAICKMETDEPVETDEPRQHSGS